MSARAKIFRNGGSQAVRLPSSCRFPEDQDEVVLEPVDVWPAAFLRCLGAWPEDIERPLAGRVGDQRDPFA